MSLPNNDQRYKQKKKDMRRVHTFVNHHELIDGPDSKQAMMK
jgi:hypothetical protein